MPSFVLVNRQPVVVVPACVLQDSCRLNDLIGIDDYAPSAMLGSWQMVAKATPDVPTLYREFSIKFYFVGHNEIRFKMNGYLNE